jgi:catechol 2,3-dioxygenase-like lactoylglutathione lyase family enzyme
MAKIRHIAHFAKDQAKMVEFYTQTFGIKIVLCHPSASTKDREAVDLSDGYLNLANLPAREGRPEGLDHFGFQVDSKEETVKLAVEVGAPQGPEGTPRDGRFAEAFIRDPIGVRVDLSEAGWRMEPLVRESKATTEPALVR